MFYVVRSIILILLIQYGSWYNCFAQPIKKLSPLIQEDLEKNKAVRTFRISFNVSRLPHVIDHATYKVEKLASFDSISVYHIKATYADLIENILPLPEVVFVEDGMRKPVEEQMINNLDLSVNQISTAHNKFPQWNGNGLTFSLKENKPDTVDIDFAGRYVSNPLTSKTISQHATTMATMIAGGGNSWYLKGAAWGSNFVSSDFANLLPDPNNILQQYNISVQNHSYGVGIENFYGADAGLYDASSINSSLLHIFSSGNAGGSSSTTGIYAGLAGYANLTGSFKMAKNIITVGATDSFHNVVALSSRGPAYDGRLKPELVAFGVDGSSGAAALTSGVALVMQQAYKDQFGNLPQNALVKAVLLNSADDRGNKEVDFANGFGSLNALNALRTITGRRFLTGNITNGSAQSFFITVPPGVKKLKATLVWTDPPASPNAAKALVNDLDLELINTLTNEKLLPWVLNKFPHVDSLRLPASRKRDSVNNAEQVTLENPVSGNYQLVVKGYNVNVSTQEYFIAYQFDSSDIFEWYFPLVADPVLPSMLNTIRWKSSYATNTARLAYSIDKGISWQTIDPSVNLVKEYHQWDAPQHNGKALLRMQINSLDFVSDTFTMASRTQTGIGFNCPDSFLFFWNKIPQATAYRLYTMGNKYLEPILTTPLDSFKVLQKAAYPSKYFAIAPLFNNREGVKSYTLDYSLQGVDCYVRSFFATLVNNDVVELSLSLGSVFNITKITLEKKVGNQFVPLETRINNILLQLGFADNNPTPGINSYRVRIDLAGGGIAYTLIENIFYFNDGGYVIYPNPALQGAVINIAQQNVDAAIMQVFNATGTKVYERILDDRINNIPSNTLSKGLHFIRIIKNSRTEKVLKLLVL